MTIQASLKILPKGENRIASYALVDECLKMIMDSKLPYIIGPSETTVQGELDEVMDLIKRIHRYYYDNNIEFSFFMNSEYNNENFYIEKKIENVNKLK